MSGPKAALKAIGAAVKAQKYDDAVQAAQKLLASDPKNYQAYVNLSKQLFLAFPSNSFSHAKLLTLLQIHFPRICFRQTEQTCRC